MGRYWEKITEWWLLLFFLLPVAIELNSITPIICGLILLNWFAIKVSREELRKKLAEEALEKAAQETWDNTPKKIRASIVARSLETYISTLGEDPIAQAHAFQRSTTLNRYSTLQHPLRRILQIETNAALSLKDDRITQLFVDRLLLKKDTTLNVLDSLTVLDTKSCPLISRLKNINHELSRIVKGKSQLEEFINNLTIQQTNIARGESDVDSMSGKQFEKLVGEIFRLRGYTIKFTPASGDYGVDIIASKNGNKIAIQCKRYDSKSKIGNEDILKLSGGQRYYSADSAMLITTSKVTKMAREAAKQIQIKFWERERLFQEIERSGIYRRSSELESAINRCKELYSELNSTVKDSYFDKRPLTEKLNEIEAFLDTSRRAA